MAVSWKDEYSVGVQIIDDQHKELFDRTNQLLNACTVGKGKEEVSRLIDFLDEYVKKHFSQEEEYQKKYQYPKYEEHKKLHQNFIQEVKNLKSKLNQNGSSLSLIVEINNKVIHWLVNHIGKVDKELGLYLVSQNVK